MFYALKIFFRDNHIRIPLGLLIVLLSAVWWYVSTRIHPTENQIFLHYNIIFGIDLAGGWQKIYYLPGVATAIVGVNYLMSFLLYRTDITLARIISVLTVPIELFLA